MDRGRENGFYGNDQGGDLPNFPNSHTFPLNSPSWYTPTPRLPNPNSFVWNHYHQKPKSYNQTSVPSNAFTRDICSSTLASDQRLGVDNMFQDGERFSIMEELRNHPSVDFTNQVMMKPLNQIANSGSNTSRNNTKRLWTTEEDSKLNELVSVFGTKNWATISDFMDGRAGKQCRERWNNNLRPDIKSDVWTEEEERILIEAHEKKGNKWSQIAKLLPGRTENGIKNHWNAATRKKTMRLNRSRRYEPNNAKPKSTLLRDYIRGMSSTSTGNTTNGNASIGELNVIQQDEQPSSFSSDNPSIDLIPSYDEEFSFMIKDLSSTNVAQAEITTSTEPTVQVLEPRLHANMNPQGFIGNNEYGTSSSSILIEDSFDHMYLNSNPQTDTQFFSNAYLSRTLSEPVTFSNSSEIVYGYEDIVQS